MENIILIVVLLLVVALAVMTLIKRAGRKGCCASGGYKPRKKKLSHVAQTKAFYVDGMQCQHCADRVTEAVNDLAHVAGRVDLKKGTLTVSYEQEVPDETICARVAHAGYTLRAAE